MEKRDILTELVLLDEKNLFSLAGNVFKYLDTPKLPHILEKEPKSICVPEKQVISTNSETGVKSDSSNNKPPTCKKCGEIILLLSNLSNIEGDFPFCKSCAKEREARL